MLSTCPVSSVPSLSSFLNDTRRAASQNMFMPRRTVRCLGSALFRTRAAGDAACLLEMDKTIVHWKCLSGMISWDGNHHIPDFAVERSTGSTLVDISTVDGDAPPTWARAVADLTGQRYEVMDEAVFAESFRLANARKIVSCANCETTLQDRLALLSFLNEHGPASMATCMSTFGNVCDPVEAIASLALKRFVEIEIDEALLGPETIVSSFRD